MRKRIALTIAAFALVLSACGAVGPPKTEDVHLFVVNVGDQAVTCIWYMAGGMNDRGASGLSCDWDA